MSFRISRQFGSLTLLACLCLEPALVAAQSEDAVRRHRVRYDLDSSEIRTRSGDIGPAFSHIVSIDGVSWLRLHFDEARLGRAAEGEAPTRLRLTGLEDGAVQILDATALARWRNSSAYFNGDAILIELLTAPGAAASRLTMSAVTAGPPGGGVRSLCGDDDRVLDEDNRIARLMPSGCTAWLIDDANGGFLTAGHCDNGIEIVELDVPLSAPDGSLRHPPPEHQYAIDPDSIQTNGGLGAGDDWAYFGTFPNPITGLMPRQAAGAAFGLTHPPPSGPDHLIRVAGYGTTTDPVPDEWNRALKSQLGPLVDASDTGVAYAVDTTTGSSGGPVIDAETGMAIAIHDHGGCNAGGNLGTPTDHDGLRAALARPRGTLRPHVAFAFPEGPPGYLVPEGHTLEITAQARDGYAIAPDSGTLWVDDGSGRRSQPMRRVEPGRYQAVFPELACGGIARFVFTVDTTDGVTVSSLSFSPDGLYRAPVAERLETVFADDFEDEVGWQVINGERLREGAWSRGVPVGGGRRGIPAFDGDLSGRCYVTGNNHDFEDIDDGATHLISPPIEVTGTDAHLGYWRWLAMRGNSLPEDGLTVSVSGDLGVTWTELESLRGMTGETKTGWVFRRHRVADLFPEGSTMLVRFSASGLGVGAIVEAAVDGVTVTDGPGPARCGSPCLGERNADERVDRTDLMIYTEGWPWRETVYDLTGNDRIDLIDLIRVLAERGPCAEPSTSSRP